MNHWRTSDFFYQIAAVLGGEGAKSDGEGAGGGGRENETVIVQKG